MSIREQIPRKRDKRNEKINPSFPKLIAIDSKTMPQNNYNQSQQEFQQFRDKLYQSFNYRRDTVMDLVDAIAVNTTARSPVELSLRCGQALSSLFPRKYSALYKGIQEMSRTTQNDSTEFDLKDETTWHEPNEIVQTNFTTTKGRLLKVKIRSWSEMLMRGSHDCPMHRQPFSLMQIQVMTTVGIRIWKPMWLIMVGQRRNELTITEAYQSYRQRYDLEHLLRFGKQKLLLNIQQVHLWMNR